MQRSNFPSLFIREAVFFQEGILIHLLDVFVDVWINLWGSTGLHVYVGAITRMFGYNSDVIYLEIWHCNPSALFLLLNVALAILCLY